MFEDERVDDSRLLEGAHYYHSTSGVCDVHRFGRPDHSAVERSMKSIRLDPKFALAYNNRGVAYKNKGELDRAIADYDEAIRLNPNYALPYDNRGNAYKDKGEYDRAIADLDAAIRLNPNYAKAYNDRGVVYASKRDYIRAIADYDQALTSDLDDPHLTEVRQNREPALAATATPPE